MVLNLHEVADDICENPVAAALPQFSMKAEPELAEPRVRPAVAYHRLTVIKQGPQTRDIIRAGSLRAQASHRRPGAPHPGVDHVHAGTVTDLHGTNKLQSQNGLARRRPTDLRHRGDLPVTGQSAAHRIVTPANRVEEPLRHLNVATAWNIDRYNGQVD